MVKYMGNALLRKAAIDNLIAECGMGNFMPNFMGWERLWEWETSRVSIWKSLWQTSWEMLIDEFVRQNNSVWESLWVRF